MLAWQLAQCRPTPATPVAAYIAFPDLASTSRRWTRSELHTSGRCKPALRHREWQWLQAGMKTELWRNMVIDLPSPTGDSSYSDCRSKPTYSHSRISHSANTSTDHHHNQGRYNSQLITGNLQGGSKIFNPDVKYSFGIMKFWHTWNWRYQIK